MHAPITVPCTPMPPSGAATWCWLEATFCVPRAPGHRDIEVMSDKALDVPQCWVAVTANEFDLERVEKASYCSGEPPVSYPAQ